MKLSKKLEEILKDTKSRMRLALELDVSFATLTRWTYGENEKLATLPLIIILERVTGLKQEEMFEQEETIDL